MNKILKIVIGIIIVVLVLSFFKDVIIKTSVEKGVQVVTGLKLRIQGFKVGIINTLVGIKGLQLFNPAGFKDRVMLDMPEIYVDYDLPAALKGKVHLSEMRINMKELVVVKNEKGELNLDSLRVVQAEKKGAGQKMKGAPMGAIPEIQIDKLSLKIGKAIYKDYSKGGKPSVQEFDVNLDETYTNITNPYKLFSLILVKTLMNTTIARLANFDLGPLKGAVSETLATAQKVATQAAATAVEAVKELDTGALKGAAHTTTEAVKDTAETLKNTTEGLADIFKMPFGSKEE
ncbi:hypothetical protein ACFL42_03605 [Candidatus Omnitrophota bacterium]